MLDKPRRAAPLASLCCCTKASGGQLCMTHLLSVMCCSRTGHTSTCCGAQTNERVLVTAMHYHAPCSKCRSARSTVRTKKLAASLGDSVAVALNMHGAVTACAERYWLYAMLTHINGTYIHIQSYAAARRKRLAAVRSTIAGGANDAATCDSQKHVPEHNHLSGTYRNRTARAIVAGRKCEKHSAHQSRCCR